MVDETTIDSRRDKLKEKVEKSGIVSELNLTEKVDSYSDTFYDQETGMYYGGEKKETSQLIGGNSVGQKDRIHAFLLSRPEFLDAISELELIEKKENLDKAKIENKDRGKAAQEYYMARHKIEELAKSLIYAEVKAGNPGLYGPAYLTEGKKVEIQPKTPEKTKEQIKKETQKANEEKERLKEARKAEKERQKEEKRLQKAEAKNRKRAEKEARKAERKAEKEARKAERKAAKEARKAERKAEKEARKAERKAEKEAKKAIKTNNITQQPTNDAPAQVVVTSPEKTTANDAPAQVVVTSPKKTTTNDAPAQVVVTSPEKEKINIDKNVQWALNAVPSNVQQYMKDNEMLDAGAKWMNSRQLSEYLKTAEFEKEKAEQLSAYLTNKKDRLSDYLAYKKKTQGMSR